MRGNEGGNALTNFDSNTVRHVQRDSRKVVLTAPL